MANDRMTEKEAIEGHCDCESARECCPLHGKSAALSSGGASSERDCESVQDGGSLNFGEGSSATCHDLVVAQRLLLLSNLAGRSIDQSFQFVLVIFLSTAVMPEDSLLLVSSYGLFTSLAVFFLGCRAGSFLDEGARHNGRLVAIRNLLFGQYVCAVTCIAFCLTLLIMSDSESTISTVMLLIAIHVFGAATEVCNQATTMAIEKDWVVVMSGNDNMFLTETNAFMRQIDLGCKALAPAATGACIAAIGLRSSFVLLCLMNIASCAVEWVSLRSVCSRIQALVIECREEAENGSNDAAVGRRESGLRNGLRTYFSQSIAAGGLALALMYVNPISAGGMMSSYLIWKGVPLHLLGIFRGVASVCGMAGGWLYYMLVTSCNVMLVTTARVSVTMYFFFLLSCLFFLEADEFSLLPLAVGICLSRAGLWIFDLSISQLFQSTVTEESRGIVSGTQQSLQSLFEGLHFGLGLVFSDPKDFGKLASIGVLAVATSFFLVRFRLGNIVVNS